MTGTKDVTRRRVVELFRGALEIILHHLDGLQVRDAPDELARKIRLTDHERGSYENGARRSDKSVRLGTLDCVKAGFEHRERSVAVQ